MSFFSKTEKRTFLDKPDIIDYLRESNNYTPDEDLASADGFLLYDSGDQRRWLLATKYRLYSVTDDTMKREPLINWSISRSLMLDHGSATLPLNTYLDKKGASLIDIGYRPRNHFTPELFTDNGLKERILKLVEERLFSGTNYKFS